MDRPFKIGDLVWATFYTFYAPARVRARVLGFVTEVRDMSAGNGQSLDVVFVTYLKPYNSVINGQWVTPFRGLDHVEAHNKGIT